MSAAPSSTAFSLALDQQLGLAVNQVDRINILAQTGGNSSFKLDFNNPPMGDLAEIPRMEASLQQLVRLFRL
jgi:hypothetical protein